MEVWRKIEEFPAYSVSSYGRVKGPQRMLTPSTTIYGYHQVTIYHNEMRWYKRVHRLVALAFLGPPPTGKHEVAHNDGCRTNNRLENLRWATRAENEADKRIHGTRIVGSKNPKALLTESQVRTIRYRVAQGDTQASLAKAMGVCRSAVNHVVTGRTWSHIQ